MIYYVLPVKYSLLLLKNWNDWNNWKNYFFFFLLSKLFQQNVNNYRSVARLIQKSI